MQEQRNYVRYDVEGSVNLKLQDGASDCIKAYLLNLSYEGISVSANERIDEGREIDLELLIKFWDCPIAGRGKVKSLQEIKRYEGSIFRIGIAFIDIDKTAIKSIISQAVKDSCEAARKRRG